MAKATLQLSIDEKIKEQAKILAVKTKLTVSEIFELLLNGTSEKEILQLYEKK